jgi:hypothetical protein
LKLEVFLDGSSVVARFVSTPKTACEIKAHSRIARKGACPAAATGDPRHVPCKESVMKKLSMFTAVALLLAQPVFAADNPWFGTWKLNRSKSTFTGSTTKVTKTGNAYHFDLGALKYDVIEDGVDHPIVPDHTSNLKSTGKNEWLEVDKVKGVETSRSKMTLSSDGNTLTMVRTGTRADGSTYKAETKVVRVGAGSGLAGTWKDVSEDSSAKETMVYSDGGNGKLKMQYVEAKSETVVALDGTPATENSPRATPGETFSYKKASPTELKYTVLMQGKPFVEGMQTVSADGKVLKDVSWLVSQPTEKTTEIFEKE